ncbi:MAG: putative collagen-binding domain-containing protein, partial [Eubacteriales bacterium]|nr:putative collagen-binding domain-containing protein [Eubacteriales bacterium]
YGTYDEMDYAAAARAEDGSFAVVYLPSARPVKFNMVRFNSSKTAKWFDMTNNTIKEAGTYKNEGILELPVPPKNSAGQTDWIVVLE